MERINDEDRMWRRDWYNHGRGISRAALTHLSVLVGVAVTYTVIHQFLAPAFGGFWRNHAADVMAGVALPAIAALLSDAQTPAGRFVRSAEGRLILIAFASLVWEGLAPLLLNDSVSDALDVMAYFAGTLAYIVVSAASKQNRITEKL